MDSLFGVPLTSILLGLLALLALSLAVLGWIAWRQPVLVRMGLRNLRRRLSQTTLIVVGLMLSTLIISAAFATGDTVGYSLTNEVYTSLGEVDYVLSFDPDRAEAGAPQHLTDGDLAALRSALADDPEIDAVTGVSRFLVPALNPQQRLSEPKATFVGVDPTTVAPFHGLRSIDGEELDAATLGPRDAFITDDLAEEINAAIGSTVRVFFEREAHDFTVVELIRGTAVATAEVLSAETGGGIVVNLDASREVAGSGDEIDFIAISIIGGVRDTLDRSSAIEDRLELVLEEQGIPAEMQLTKEELVSLAELFGSIFVTFFLVFGLFSIAAGVMLIFLIFVMLAAERRSEMGMARAIGMSRLHLTEMFIAEGMAYNVGSAAIGGLLGLGVAALLVVLMNRIFSDEGFSLVFHFNWQGFLIAYSLGVVLTFITVAFSAYRSVNLNIVRAIRDLPEPQPLRAADRSLGRLLRAMAGALWFLAWVGIAALGSVLAFAAFILGLATYGAGLLLAALVGGFFVFGARMAGRPFSAVRGWRRLLYLLWWPVFNVIAVATWFLLRTHGWAERHRNSGGWAVWMLLIGLVLIYFGGWDWGQAFAYTGGFTLAVLALAMLAVYYGVRPRAAFTAAGLGLVWYWLLPLPFSLLTDVGDASEYDPIDVLARLLRLPRPHDIQGNIEMFFVSGVSITASATLALIFNADVLLRGVSAFGGVLGGIAPALRTAIAYPLAAKFRTAMTLAMFTLVVFSLVVMATLNSNFVQLFLGEEATAGFDVVAEANPNNRIPDLRVALSEAGYEGENGLTGVGTVALDIPDVRERGGDREYRRYMLRGVDPEFLSLARLPFKARAASFDSDEAVIAAVLRDPTLVFADDFALGLPEGQIGGPDPDEVFSVHDGDEIRDGEPFQPIPIQVRDRDTGLTTNLRIIAFLEPQVTTVLFVGGGIFAHRDVLNESFEGGEQESFFITTADHSKDAAREVARDIESTLLERGVQAESVREVVDDVAAQSNAFQLLFEGFMGLGLIVGIAALGVIAFRTVVERRQQIGMLRAIGYSRRLVALSFFMESSFISLAGITMGLVLGTALSFNLLTSEEFTDGAEIDFAVPWLRIVVIAAIAYGASAVMTLIPARAASRVPVAEALRYE